MRISLSPQTLAGALVIALFGLLQTRSSSGATIWTGPNTNFTQTGTVRSDFLTSHAIITRASSGPIYNSVYETFGNKSISPTNTEWATGALSNYNALTYKTFINWANSPGDTAAGILNVQAVCHIKNDDIYFAVKFTQWGRFGAGGFAYTRSTAVAAPPPPAVTITNPPSGTIYAAPANVKLGATASVSSGTVTNVSFFRGGTLIGSSTTVPFSVVAGNLTAATYSMTAVATAAGVSATSPPVSVTVINPVPVTMTTPVVSNGAVTFNYSADPGLLYSVQSSDDFITWNSRSTNAAAVSSVPFTEALASTNRFYRVARLPNP
jgi:hypothetical protein